MGTVSFYKLTVLFAHLPLVEPATWKTGLVEGAATGMMKEQLNWKTV
jgi:hypothetical protein